MPIPYYNFIFGFLMALTSPALASEEAIKMRKYNMQRADETMSAIKDNILKSNYSQAIEDARFIHHWASTMLDYFPRGSGASITNSSAASNEIWTNFTAFQNFITDKKKTAGEMIKFAKNSDAPNLLRAFNATRNVCNACHERFRN